ncbi:MAG: hypothetical protein ACJ71Q_07845 [Terriglobales bacterium]
MAPRKKNLQKNRAAVELGRLGGRARALALTKKERSEQSRKAGKARLEKIKPEKRSEIARRAVQARWAKKNAIGEKHDSPAAPQTIDREQSMYTQTLFGESVPVQPRKRK